ncbi:hypothetical protein ABFS82_10G007300 [Erythranthe guttata]|nr:PREDICTED: TOM1-like protein 2 [Erythranthe guttata]|eukprot:XP_012832244.1 PREDICTED: TOM1-like protein 2 [Erythranthe guttata]
MISSMASISSSSSATVRVEKATSEFLIGPDWTLNIDICDTINSNQMLAKDVVKAVKKRLQHKNPRVQLLALTLLETMVKNCGDYVHFQIAERNILPEMVKIAKKKTDMNVRDKVLVLIGSWHQAFGGAGGKYPQYYMAYEDLRRYGVDFPRNSVDAVPIFTPPVTHPPTRHQFQPGYGMPSTSSTRLDQAMAAEENLSVSSLNSMNDVLDLLADMLQAVDPSDRSAVKDEVIIDLVEQCQANQKKLVQLLANTGDEEILGKGLELNDSLQIVLAKHDAIASGSPLPPQVRNITNGESEKRDSTSTKSAEPSVQNAPPPPEKNSPPVLPEKQKGVADEEDDEEEDDFALLARRHSKARVEVSNNTSAGKADVAPAESSTSNALVPVDVPTSVRTKEQDIIDLLSITLSTPTSNDQTPQSPTPPMQNQGNIPSSYPANHGLGFNNYIAPWAQPQPQHQQIQSQPRIEPQQNQPQFPQYPTQQPLNSSYQQQPKYANYTSMYPPPPWAATPGYFTNNQSPAYTYSTGRPTFEAINGETQVNSGLTSSSAAAANNVGQRPFIPSYRLFEDLNVLGSADGRFKATTNASGSNNQGMVGGRKL